MYVLTRRTECHNFSPKLLKMTIFGADCEYVCMFGRAASRIETRKGGWERRHIECEENQSHSGHQSYKAGGVLLSGA